MPFLPLMPRLARSVPLAALVAALCAALVAASISSAAGVDAPAPAPAPTGWCASVNIVELVTACAKRNELFLRCVGRGNQGPSKQCACLQENEEIQDCIGNCLPTVYEALCTPIWTPARTAFIAYEPQAQPLTGIDGIYLINLPRRNDRLSRFLRTNPFSAADFHIVTAFDGKELVWSPSLAKLFGKNRFGTKRGLVGQALSHYQIWRHAAETNDQFHLIMEDDVEFPEHFVKEWNAGRTHAFPVDAQVVFLGGVAPANMDAYLSGDTMKRVSRHFNEHIPSAHYAHIWDETLDGESVKQQDKQKAFHYKPIAYILSSKGARDLVSMVKKHGFTQPVGVMLMHAMMRWEGVFASFPLLVKEVSANPMYVGGVDSDTEFDDAPVAGAPRLAQGTEYKQSASNPKQNLQLPHQRVNNIGPALRSAAPGSSDDVNSVPDVDVELSNELDDDPNEKEVLDTEDGSGTEEYDAMLAREEAMKQQLLRVRRSRELEISIELSLQEQQSRELAEALAQTNTPPIDPSNPNGDFDDDDYDDDVDAYGDFDDDDDEIDGDSTEGVDAAELHHRHSHDHRHHHHGHEDPHQLPQHHGSQSGQGPDSQKDPHPLPTPPAHHDHHRQRVPHHKQNNYSRIQDESFGSEGEDEEQYIDIEGNDLRDTPTPGTQADFDRLNRILPLMRQRQKEQQQSQQSQQGSKRFKPKPVDVFDEGPDSVGGGYDDVDGDDGDVDDIYLEDELKEDVDPEVSMRRAIRDGEDKFGSYDDDDDEGDEDDDGAKGAGDRINANAAASADDDAAGINGSQSAGSGEGIHNGDQGDEAHKQLSPEEEKELIEQELSRGQVDIGNYRGPIVVVSLPASKDRLSRFHLQMVDNRMKYTVHTATDGRHLNFDKLVEKQLVKPMYPSKMLGSAGQALSHLLLLEKIAKSSYQVGVVLEDDALVPANALDVIGNTLYEMRDTTWDILFLGCNPNTCFTENADASFIKYPSTCIVSPHAYVINRTAASHLMHDFLPMNGSLREMFTSKDFLTYYNAFCIAPTLISQRPGRKDRALRDS